MSKINSPKHSTHHEVAKQIGGTNQRNNLVELRHSTHQALHTLFGNDIMPDKIRKLIGIEYTALKEDVKTKLLNLLQEIGDDKENWYKPETYKN